MYTAAASWILPVSFDLSVVCQLDLSWVDSCSEEAVEEMLRDINIPGLTIIDYYENKIGGDVCELCGCRCAGEC